MFGHPDEHGTNGAQPVTGAPQAGGMPPAGNGATNTGSAAPASGAPAVHDDLLGDFVMEDPKKTAESPVNPAKHTTTVAQDELLSIKQQALQQLSPLVDHLNQTPEEKFRTTMMLIQAADNQALLKDAYAAAQAITDEKVRAQALLDVVNEINYFTQSQDKDDHEAK